MNRNHRRLGLGVTLAILTLAAGTARAVITIDNFEEGTNGQVLVAIGSVTSNQTGLATGNVIGGSRQAILSFDASFSGGQQVSATLNPDNPNFLDDNMDFSAQTGAQGTLKLGYGSYSLAGDLNADFSQGGLNNALGVVLPFATVGATGTVVFTDGVDTQSFTQAISVGTNVFLFANYVLIDFTGMDGVQVQIAGARGGTYQLALTELNTYELTTGVPEPSIFGLCALGGVLLGLRRRR